jgi:multicomponent K+:H+ antiporter subunit C
VFIFLMGRLWTNAQPILVGEGPVADPLPQALVLTAIVIGFATTGFIIELALRSRHESGSDHVDGHEPGHAVGRPAVSESGAKGGQG